MAFHKPVAPAYPAAVDEHGRPIQLDLIMDNYATHKRVEVRDWLAVHPPIRVHFAPTSGSWLNLVEIWFGIIDRQAIRRGAFGSVKDLNAKTTPSSTAGRASPPFIWTKTPEEILKKANRPRISKTNH